MVTFAGTQVAIITDTLKKQLAQTIFDELSDSANLYYIGISRSQDWDSSDFSPEPLNTVKEKRDLRYNLQSVKAVEAYSFVVPRYNWTSGSVYSAYSDNVEGQTLQSSYVVTDDFNVYVCIRPGYDASGVPVASTTKPTSTSATTLAEEADGYVWKFLYTLTANDQNRFVTANYIPVALIDSAAPTEPTYPQFSVQNAASPKQIIGYRVTYEGGAYTQDPVVTIIGNGSGAHARALVTPTGKIGAVLVDDSENGFPFGTGYDYANVVISGGGAGAVTATAVPIFGPNLGLGGDARDDLRSTAVMCNIKPNGTEENTFIVNNDFRQIGLFRNIKQYDSDGLFALQRGVALGRMNMASTSAQPYLHDDIITGDNTGAQAYVDFYNDSSQIWYHQDEYTGFTPFEDGENIVGTNAAAAIADSANVAPDVDKFSGDLLYIDNRTLAITRSTEQTEDIKVVIQL